MNMSGVLPAARQRLRYNRLRQFQEGESVMSVFTKSVLCAAFVVVLFASAASADWTPIAIIDPSFEATDAPDWDDRVAPAWGTAHAADPRSDGFDGTDGDDANALGVLPNGGQVGLLESFPARGANYLYVATQTTGHTIAAGEQYQLGFYYGAHKDTSVTWGAVIASLLDGSGNVIGTQTFSTAPTPGTFLSATMTATATAGNSGMVGIRLETATPSSGYYWDPIDSVSLSYRAVPEPGTLALLAAGLLGLVAYAWRKRNY
jgi:hypothetical protein